MDTILITTSSFSDKDPSPLEKLKGRGFAVVLNPHGRKLTEGEIGSLIREHQPVALLAGVEPLTAAVLGLAAPHLKVISRCGIGMDSVDLEAAAALGITVTNTPDAPTIPVAELTLGLMLSLLRKIHVSDASIRAGGWERPMGSLLHGKKVGIIGCGRIGSRVANVLTVMECRVMGHDPAVASNLYCEMASLESLLRDADMVSLHLPYSAQTHHFMDYDRLQMMKRGACLVNASRGGLIDEAVLLQALQSGHLAGAALDCFENEPYTGPLKNMDNVLLTGHIGSYAREARSMMEMQAVDNILRVL